MRVFIGSSREQKDLALTIASWLEDLDVSPVLWCDNTTFELAEFTWTQLIEISHTVDAAIFVFAADDKTWFRGKETDSVRDNVILEYGLFSGAISSKNVCFVRSENADIPSDLLGITYADIGRVNQAQIKIKNWINSIKSTSVGSANTDGRFNLVSMGTAFSMVLQQQTTFDKLRVFAVSAVKGGQLLRTHTEIKIHDAVVLLREFKVEDKYYQKSMEETVKNSILVWEAMQEHKNIDSLSILRFDFHPTCGLYIFDDKFLIYGNLSFDAKENRFYFEQDVIVIDSKSLAGSKYINNCIEYFDLLASNYNE